MKRNSGNILLIILAVAGILATLVGGYFWWASKTASPARQVETKIVDDTSQWKLFKSDNYGFTFKYPNNWEFQIPSPSGDFEDTGALDLYANGFTHGVSMKLEIVPISGTTFNLQEQSVRSYGWKNLVINNIVVAETRAEKFSGNIKDNRKGSAVLFQNNKFVYRVETVFLNDDPLFDQILSTFKFL